MEEMSKNTTKAPVHLCNIENYKNPENSIQIQPSFLFLPQPMLTG